MARLCIKDALHLHQIVSPHMPEVNGEESALDLVREVVRDIKETNPHDYVDAILLMSGMSLEELQKLDSMDILKLFIDGLMENQILLLDSFCTRLGVKYG